MSDATDNRFYREKQEPLTSNSLRIASELENVAALLDKGTYDPLSAAVDMRLYAKQLRAAAEPPPVLSEIRAECRLRLSLDARRHGEAVALARWILAKIGTAAEPRTGPPPSERHDQPKFEPGHRVIFLGIETEVFEVRERQYVLGGGTIALEHQLRLASTKSGSAP